MAVVDAVVEVDEGVRRPDFALQFLAAYDLARSPDQNLQDLQRLILQFELGPVATQFSRGDIKFKFAEADLVSHFCRDAQLLVWLLPTVGTLVQQVSTDCA